MPSDAFNAVVLAVDAAGAKADTLAAREATRARESLAMVGYNEGQPERSNGSARDRRLAAEAPWYDA